MKEALEFPEQGLVIEGSLLSQVAEDDESILRMSNDGGDLLLSRKAVFGYGSIEKGLRRLKFASARTKLHEYPANVSETDTCIARCGAHSALRVTSIVFD